MNHLLVISLGPVQEFIAAARRTQDLQAGSRLLVELARAAAVAVRNAGGTLIFPSEPERDGPNKILAEIPASLDPALVAQGARLAAQQHLEREWSDAFRGVKRFVDADRADKQVQSFLEFYAAWHPVGSEGYAVARRSADRLLAGRKALRDFEPVVGQPGVHKSPLDPTRESVLNGLDGRVPEKAKEGPLWLKETEMLDAVSLLKRWKGGNERDGNTPSTSTMALRSILSALERDAPEQIEELQMIAEQANGGVDLGDLFLPTDLEEHLNAPDLDRVRTLCREAIKRIGRGECPPYFAILIADGDKMGKLLDECDSAPEHRAVSRALTEFADTARGVVHDHRGYPIYCGGDDVVAMVPVSQALDCAASLAEHFASAMAPFLAGSEGGTLSAGIAIVHCREPLQTSLDRARSAEKVAKQRRNSLAVALHTRGGSPIVVSEEWGNGRCVQSWDAWTEALAEGVSRGAPYELAALAREWEGTGLPPDRLKAEALRILGRKKGKEKADLRMKDETLDSVEDLKRVADRMVVARFLAGYRKGAEHA
jgi:CRISPR-associated protein Cmr2